MKILMPLMLVACMITGNVFLQVAVPQPDTTMGNVVGVPAPAVMPTQMPPTGQQNVVPPQMPVAQAPTGTEPVVTYDEMITALGETIRKSEPIGDVDLPAELPRFQKSDALPVDLAPAQKVQWDATVGEIEKIVLDLKRLPEKLKLLSAHVRKLRDMYRKP